MSSPTTTLINIGTHSLALYPHGPQPTTSTSPVILFIPGVCSSSLVWAAVIRLLPPSLRSYTYDRSGYGLSSPSPLPPTAENIALELSLLLKASPLSNPLILVGHSWAGILIREFIALTGPQNIAGLVLVDANHETSLQVLDVNDANLAAVFEGVDFYDGIGVSKEHKLTDGEWDAFLADEATGNFKVQGQQEDIEYSPSFLTLRKKNLEIGEQPLLRDKPVFVIGGFRSRDWKGLIKMGVERGNGTEEQRRRAMEMIEGADEKHMSLIEKHLKLSKRGKLVWAKESGHFVQLTQPDVVVDGIQWALDELKI